MIVKVDHLTYMFRSHSINFKNEYTSDKWGNKSKYYLYKQKCSRDP